jgi:hypothetical protein
MYYCQSRYYVPEIYRWLNIDNANFLKEDDINKLNLFVYCSNNPVMGMDNDGHFAISALFIGALISLAATAFKDYRNDGEFFNGDVTAWEYVGSTVAGALGGAAGQAGHVLTRIGGAVCPEIIGGAISENVNYSWESLRDNIVTGIVASGMAESLTIVGKRVGKSIFSKGCANASKKGQKELAKFVKSGGTFNVTNPSALNVLNKVDRFAYAFNKMKNITGNFYGFVVGSFGNLINW